jgi:hypothetical protein
MCWDKCVGGEPGKDLTDKQKHVCLGVCVCACVRVGCGREEAHRLSVLLYALQTARDFFTIHPLHTHTHTNTHTHTRAVHCELFGAISRYVHVRRQPNPTETLKALRFMV